MTLSAKEFGLPTKTVLEQIDENTIAIVIDRKSRIIMADGKKILAKTKKIKAFQPLCTIVLKTSAPICSKTIQFFEIEGIRLIRF